MKNKSVHLPFGLISGLIIILIIVIQHYLNLPSDSQWSNLALVPMPIGIIACCLRYSKVNDGFVTFGQTFACGFKAAAIIALLAVGFVLLATYIWPEMLDNAYLEAEKAFEANKGLSDQQRTEMLAMTKKFAKIGIVGTSLFIYMFLGAVFAVIGAAVAKKNGPRMTGEILDQPQTF